MKQNKRLEVDTLFVKDDRNSYKSHKKAENEKMQIFRGPKKTSLNYVYNEEEFEETAEDSQKE